MCLYLIIVIGAVIFNYCYSFGFFCKNGDFIGIWLFFYAIILPVGAMLYVFNNYGSSSNFRKNSLLVFVVYLLSVFISAFESFDFRNFEILGDGETKFIISSILIVCLISSCCSFLVFKIKRGK